jgi:uncharacterized protein
MNCPKCYTDMKKIEFEGVEVDRCYNCYGLWFDFQEHQQLKDRPGAAEIDSGDLAMGRRTNLFDKINCPRDGALMTHLVDLKQPHIGYEACPYCYGVFFDAGEFKDYSRQTLLESIKDLFPREGK